MRKKGRWKAIVPVVLALLIVAGTIGYLNRGALAALGYDWFLADQVEKKLENSYQPLEGRTPEPSESPKIEKPFSLLLMGVDARKNERGRSDTLIYSVIRPQDGNVLMLSIPRDTYAEIVGKDKRDKITHSYVYGGPEMTVASVEKLLEAKIDHYASINFQGFVEVVDTLGGVSLPITKDIVNDDPGHEKFVVKANQSSYDGVDALNFVRYREDAGGDTTRTERNREFLEALMSRAASLGQWGKIPEVLGIVGDNFRTDLLPESMSGLAKQFLQTDHRIQSYTLKGVGKRMGPSNLWYYVANEDDLASVRQTIADWLDPNTPAEQLKAPGVDEGTSGDRGVKVPT